MEYVALSMVEMMQGVTRGGGTAPGASAAGHPLAGKTGTSMTTRTSGLSVIRRVCNGRLDGKSRTQKHRLVREDGGGGALRFFTAFMNEFMKDKTEGNLPVTPGDADDMKSQMERRSVEELEKLEKARDGSQKNGIVYTPSRKTADIDRIRERRRTGLIRANNRNRRHESETDPVPRNDEPL